MLTFDTHAYVQRRQQLFSALPEQSAVLLHAGHEIVRNRDTNYPFRPQSDFYYLTGFNEPDAVLLLHKADGICRSHLWLREKDPLKEIWDGYRLGVTAATSSLSIDTTSNITQLDAELGEQLANVEQVYISFEQGDVWLSQLMQHIQQLKRRVRMGVSAPSAIVDLDPILHEQRLIKDSAAQQGLRAAAQATVAGHLAAMSAAKTATHEYQIQAALEATFVASGAECLAFSSIVAAGENACVLHYHQNNAPLTQQQLVLIDAGAQVNGYAGDCTHTFPLNGQFTAEQATIYRLVLAAQQAALQQVKPGTAYDQVHQAAVKVISQGLMDLGIIQHSSLDEVIEQGLYKDFYMHQTGHWLGNDVHDVGQYKQNGEWRPLVSGMALTVEPGIYIATSAQVDPKWQGIGVRIEDSVLVTDTGYECLTAGLPRSVEEIEAWMQNH